MHDPFQTYATLGSYYGLPYGGQQVSGINPMNPSQINPLINPLAGIQQAGQSPFGQVPVQSPLVPQQLQLAQALAYQSAIQQALASLLNNQLISGGLHQGGLGAYGQQFGLQQQPQFGLQQQSPFGLQQQSPWGLQGQINPQFGQIGSPFGYVGSLAPQSWIGQGGPFAGGQGFGAVNPLQALLARQFQPQGFTPWGY